MSDTVQFQQAPLPAHESILWVTQLLAQAVQEILATNDVVYDLDEVGLSSIDVPRLLGYFAARRLPTIGSSPPKGGEGGLDNERSESLRYIWNDFLQEDRIRRLPRRLLAFFEQHRDANMTAAMSGPLSFEYLRQANRAAHSFVQALLKQQSLDPLLPNSPADVDIVPDPESKRYCAASDSHSGRIQWALQIVPHALPAMVLIERVFAHEYLSHLVPRNRALGRAVTERWLVALLHETYLADPSQPQWKNILWPEYRKALEDHVAGIENAKNPALNLVRTAGYAGLEVSAAALYHIAHRVFWKFTHDILTSASNEDANWIDRVLLTFANLAPAQSKKILSCKWNNIKELHDEAGRP